MGKRDANLDKTGSERWAMAERQEAEDAVKKNLERLRAMRHEREDRGDKTEATALS